MSLEALAAFAVNNNNRAATKTPLYDLTIEAARKLVKIKDGNRKPAEDGSQALTITMGRKTLSLDAILKGTSRINATKAQVEQFTVVLQAGINDGSFDVVIKEAQEASRPVVADPVKTDETAITGAKADIIITDDLANTERAVLSMNTRPSATEVTEQNAQEPAGDNIEGLDFSGIEA